jgi:FG-GAP repeat
MRLKGLCVTLILALLGLPWALPGATGSAGAADPPGAASLLISQMAKLADLAFGWDQDHFGDFVSVSGDTALIGAVDAFYGGSAQRGTAYVFARNQGGANNWGQAAKMVASDGAYSDQFGGSTSLDGQIAAVGAPLVDINYQRDQGAAYVYRLTVARPVYLPLIQRH